MCVLLCEFVSIGTPSLTMHSLISAYCFECVYVYVCDREREKQ